jgi:hypothetical protein
VQAAGLGHGRVRGGGSPIEPALCRPWRPALRDASNQPDTYRQIASMPGGFARARRWPAWPVMRPTRFELVPNLRTAKALGLDVPPTRRALADAVTE